MGSGRTSSRDTRVQEYDRFRVRVCLLGDGKCASVVLVAPEPEITHRWAAALEEQLSAVGASIDGIRGDHSSSDGHYHNFVVTLGEELYKDKRRLSTQVLPTWMSACPVEGEKVAKELHVL